MRRFLKPQEKVLSTQLFAYFGMDPTVNESGKFKGTEVHMSKRGSRIARRAIFDVALACIGTKRNGEALNSYLCCSKKQLCI